MKRARPWIEWMVVALLVLGVPGVAGATSVSPAPGRPAASVSHRVAAAEPTAPSSATTAGERTYAEREARNPQAGDFRGGGVGIYLSSGAALVLVVLLVILLVR